MGLRTMVAKFNEKKFGQVLHYIISKCGHQPNVGKTVLYKLLYFSDFDYYELHEKPLTGENYKKIKYGPAPIHFDETIQKLKKEKKIKPIKIKYKDWSKGYPQHKFLTIQNPEINLLSGTELQIIDKVIEKLSTMGAEKISYYSHKDMPWEATKYGGIIKYGLVFYRDPAYSVREYKDDRHSESVRV